MTTAIAAPPRAERAERAEPVQERVRGRSRLTHHALVPGAAIDPAALRVMLITEGTYPFHFGGVSTWCHGLVKSMPEVDFSLIAIIDAPERPLRFELPANIVDFRPTPLWGIRAQSDLVPSSASTELRRRMRASTITAVQRDLVPLLSSFITALLVDEADPAQLADAVHGLYRYFLDHDFDVSMRSEPAWHVFTRAVVRRFPQMAAVHGHPGAPLNLADLTEGMNLLRTWLSPLAHRLPETDIAHAAMAGMCTLVATAAKRDQGAGFMLTEHGIFLRERLLAEAPGTGSLFLKLLRLRFAIRTTELSYALADRVAPCCDSHQRWELRVGAPAERLSTIYYGVDASVFRPAPRPPEAPPTVVWVGRIDPLKDVETLLRAAAVVHRSRPDIIFRVYGAALPGSEDYRDRCLALRAELGLEAVVVMEGYTSSPSAAFNEGDLVALSSISEGFPYSTLEAMLCSKAIVATAVGGIAEQVRDCGRVVEPRNAEQFGAAIVELMADPEALVELGAYARRHAMELFSQERERHAHLLAYTTMHGQPPTSPDAPSVGEGGPATGPGEAPPPPRVALAASRPALTAPGHVAPSSTRKRFAEAAAALAWRRRGRELNRELGRTAVGAKRAPVATGSALAGELGDESTTLLVDEVRRRVAMPVHGLEVSAVLESCGVTDESARRYGAQDVFDLGERVLVELRREFVPQPLAPHHVPTRAAAEPLVRLVGRWLLLAVPSLAVVAAVALLRAGGALSATSALFLMAGLLTGVFVSNVLLQGLVPRAAFYLGCGNRWFAQRVVRRFYATASAAMATAGLVYLGVARALGLGSGSSRLLFCVGFVATGLLWLSAGGLVASQSLHEVGVAVLMGGALAVVADRSLASATSEHAAVAAIAGYVLALTVVVLRSRRRLAGGHEGAPAAPLPPTRRMIREAGPHLLQAATVLGLLFVPHVVLWFEPVPAAEHALLAALELALTLALLPFLTASILIERTAKLCRTRAMEFQIATPAGDPSSFAGELATFVRRRRRIQFAYLAAASVLWAAGLEVALGRGWLGGLVPVGAGPDVRKALLVGLIGCLLLGLALFDTAVAVTLGARPVPWSFALGFAASVAAVPLAIAWLPPWASPAVLVLGALAIAPSVRRGLSNALEQADHSYFISL